MKQREPALKLLGKLWILDWGCARLYPIYFEYLCMKDGADGSLWNSDVLRAKWLKSVIDTMETSEAKRMTAKFDRIGYALRR